MTGVQTPAWQASPDVHCRPSLQVVPLATAGPAPQAPVVASQTPAAWQESEAGQVFVAPAEQAPAWQESPVVQALPSLQSVPLAAAGFEQAPVAASQVPATWQESEAVQLFGVPAEQAPAWQESPVVQALLSLQAVPLLTAGFVQDPVATSQMPAAWH